MGKGLVVFQDKRIRRVWHDNKWFFSVVDIVQALTDSSSPRQYWGVLKGRESQLLTFCLQLKLVATDVKLDGFVHIIKQLCNKMNKEIRVFILCLFGYNVIPLEV